MHFNIDKDLPAFKKRKCNQSYVNARSGDPVRDCLSNIFGTFTPSFPASKQDYRNFKNISLASRASGK